MSEIEKTEQYVAVLRDKITLLLKGIGSIAIGDGSHFPYGWRKAAKGRTVWRLVEEIISQNLEKNAETLGLLDFSPAPSEVGVYDFSFRFQSSPTIYVNIKSAVTGGRTNKDDISKAVALEKFFAENEGCQLYVLTVQIGFSDAPLQISLDNCFVMPVAWLPDVYVNPSNNGNLQSSKYKNIDLATRREASEFLAVLRDEMRVAQQKKKSK
ncbi:hypothetical protein [Ponticaulis profundi]|uniref:Restriction endonuclease n=1 Tax=Ponticaulis profundi TaxID=2665222 RepID=A0ABW1S5Z4_9PROT